MSVKKLTRICFSESENLTKFITRHNISKEDIINIETKQFPVPSLILNFYADEKLYMLVRRHKEKLGKGEKWMTFHLGVIALCLILIILAWKLFLIFG